MSNPLVSNIPTTTAPGPGIPTTTAPGIPPTAPDVIDLENYELPPYLQNLDERLKEKFETYINDVKINNRRFRDPFVIYNFFFLIIIIALVSYKINSSQESISDIILLTLSILSLLVNVYTDPYVITIIGLIMAIVAYNLNMEETDTENDPVANELIFACIIMYVLMVFVNSVNRLLPKSAK